MDYTGSGFRAGFRRGLRVAWDAMCFRPLRFEPWPAPSMPSLREHLESYGGIGMTAADFDRCEKDWYRMLDERQHAFDRYLLGHALRTVCGVRRMDSRVCDCRADSGRSVVLNRSEVLSSTAEQGIVRAGAGEHEAQFAILVSFTS